jgi:hypothetical protein
VKTITKKSSETAAGMPVLNRLLTTNLLMERQLWLRRQLDPRRNIDQECGHPELLQVADFKQAFLRGDVAKRVVTLLPEESWSDTPDIYETEDEEETEFEKAWMELEDQLQVLSMLERVDTLSGIGRFGILLLGIGDGATLNVPAPGINPVTGEAGAGGREQKLLFLRAFDESLIVVKELETNTSSPRFGHPTLYEITFEDMTGSPMSGKQLVHWTRVIHVVDNRMCSEIYGMPRMEVVFNRLLDVKKIGGGSGEMFWKGGFPGISLESSPGVDETVEFDADATKTQLEAYMNGLQRYLATVGMSAKSLTTQVADPGPHLEVQLKLIAIAMGVPWRVFIGSEAAQLASEQDSRSWNRRLNRRRTKYLNPFVITPVIDRLIALGVLPEPEELCVDWPDLNTLGDKDKAEVAQKKSDALAKYVQSGSDIVVPPFHYLTLVLGFTEDEARSIIEEITGDLADEDGVAAALEERRAAAAEATAAAARSNGEPTEEA